MYELFIGNRNYSSWSLRPWVLLRAHGVEFVEHVMPFKPGSNWRDFRAFSPSGKVPCLRDGATVVWDSLGIAEYLAERHPGLWPVDAAARAWARCATAEMHSGFAALRNHCGMNVGLRVRLREWPEALLADVRRIDELWNEGPGPVRRAVPRRQVVHDRRRVLLPGRISRAHLRHPLGWRGSWLRAALARIAGHARVGSRGARRALARPSTRG